MSRSSGRQIPQFSSRRGNEVENGLRKSPRPYVGGYGARETVRRRLQTSAFVLALFLFVIAAHASDVTVFAAASLTDSLKQIAARYEKETGHKVVLNFGASSTLERQITEGASADIFFSADEAKMDDLEKSGLVLDGTRKSELSNALVIIEPADSALAINSAKDLAAAEVKRIALADPKIVPAGIYSRKYLKSAGLWKTVGPKVVPTENVRAALAAVESGNVDAGMVYKTDAAISHKVKVVCEIAPNEGPPISYPVAVLKNSHQADGAKEFLRFIESPAAIEIFERYGFVVRK